MDQLIQIEKKENGFLVTTQCEGGQAKQQPAGIFTGLYKQDSPMFAGPGQYHTKSYVFEDVLEMLEFVGAFMTSNEMRLFEGVEV